MLVWDAVECSGGRVERRDGESLRLVDYPIGRAFGLQRRTSHGPTEVSSINRFTLDSCPTATRLSVSVSPLTWSELWNSSAISSDNSRRTAVRSSRL